MINNLTIAVQKKLRATLSNNFILRIIPLRLIFLGEFQRALFLKPDFFNKSKKQGLLYQNLFRSTRSDPQICEEGFWPFIHNHTNSIAGYVPYIKSQTSLILFHFWSINYGVRKQILGHVILLKERKIKKIFRFSLNSGEFRKINLKDLFDDDDGDIIFVEIFNPRFPSNHGGSDGQYRFWGEYSNNTSTSHSLQFPYILFDKRWRSCRASFANINYNKSTNEIKLINFYENKTIEPINHLFEKISFGYFIQSCKNSISSVWHSATYTGKKSLSVKDQFQLVALPPILNLDLQLSFLEAFTSKRKTEITFSIFDQNANFVAKQSMNLSHLDIIKCSDIFPDVKFSGMQLLVDLSKAETLLHNGYLHIIYYCGKLLCDSVHSHPLDAPSTLLKNKSILNSGYGQSLKFMHFPTGKSYKSFLSIWTNDAEIFAKLRFIDDSGNEYIKNIFIKPLGVVHYLLDDILVSLGVSLKSHFIVQLESNYSNLNANLYTYQRKNQSLSVDHLTGG